MEIYTLNIKEIQLDLYEANFEGVVRCTKEFS